MSLSPALLQMPSSVTAPAARAHRVLPRWLTPALWVIAPVAVFFCYLRVSQTYPGDFYGSVFPLQAWDMLHGNLLLHGWSLSDVSFYTTELPEYMLVDWIHGLSADVVHVAAAITFTLVLLLSALLAKGRAKGRPGAVAAVIAVGLMCAPQPGSGVFVLLLAPDHFGSCVPVLLAWLILDRARPRWYGPAAVGVLLAWVLIADPAALITGVLPLLTVCGIRAGQAVIQRRRPAWLELSLIAAALIATAISAGALALIKAQGGFHVHPVTLSLTTITALPSHLLLEAQGICLLFGCDFFGPKPGVTTVLLIPHLVGLALGVWATCAAVRRFNRDIGLVSQILLAAVLINLAAFLLWSQPYGAGINVVREMAAVLPFTAVLAGRLLAPRLTAPRLVPALSVVLLGYLLSLASAAAHPVQPPQYQQLATWLAARHFHYGIGAGPLSTEVTTTTGQRVQLHSVVTSGGFLVPSRWEADASWYTPRLHDASFMVMYGRPPKPALKVVRSTFGPPEDTYHFGLYTVMTWDKNLLTELH